MNLNLPRLTWSVCESVSCYHATAAVIRDRASVAVTVADALEEPTARLTACLESDGVPSVFFEHLIPLSAQAPSNLELADLALTKSIGKDRAATLAAKYRGLLTDLRLAFSRQWPKYSSRLHDALAETERQWKAAAIEIVPRMRQWTDPELFVEEAQVHVVAPVIGEAGAAHPRYNSIRLETTDGPDQLPRAARLGWLLGQLHLDLPRYAEALSRPRSHGIGALALLPVALSAAGDAEQPCDDALIELAVRRWPAEPLLLAGLDASVVAERLCEWWRVYCKRRPDWFTALAALDQFLSKVESNPA